MIALLEQCWKAQHRDPSPPTSHESIDLSSPAVLLRLHSRITQVIKSDGDRSVYSGILRYEPVVLEDLMEWLGKRDASLPEFVQGWCDKAGICCVSRETQIGGRWRRH